MFLIDLIWASGKLYISQYGGFYQIQGSSGFPKLEQPGWQLALTHPQQLQNARHYVNDLLTDFKTDANSCWESCRRIHCSNVRRRWQWMKFSRALEKFLEVELFSEGPGWRAREALTCPHISGKMPFQGSLVVRMELELLGLLEPLWQFGRAADCHATLNHDYSIDI